MQLKTVWLNIFILHCLFLSLLGQTQKLERSEIEKMLKDSPQDSYLQYAILQLAKRENRLEEIRFPQTRLNLFDSFLSAEAMQRDLQRETMLGRSIVSRDQEMVKIKDVKRIAFNATVWDRQDIEVAEAAKCVPKNNYFVHFGSLRILGKVLEVVQQWEKPLFSQGISDAMSLKTAEKVQKQLAIDFHPEQHMLYDSVLTNIVITGSDPFIREGSDLSIVFEYKEDSELLFKTTMNLGLVAAKISQQASSGQSEYLGIPYDFTVATSRDVCAFSCYPKPGIHIRSNSEKALHKMIETIVNKDSLGETTEFAYVRSLFSHQNKQEQAFVYFPSLFLQNFYSPELRLKERHRVICYNHLQMIHHASLLYQKQQGNIASSLSDLEKQNCSPGEFGKGSLCCPDKGQYSLMQIENGMFGHCSVHGNTSSMTPCLELPLEEVMADEAYAYELFTKNFSLPFQSLAVSLQFKENSYELDLLAIPLSDTLKQYRKLLGEPGTFDISPGSASSILKVSSTIDKQNLLKEIKQSSSYILSDNFENIILNGLDSQITMQFYDDAGSFPFELINNMAKIDITKFDNQQFIEVLANFLAQIFFDGTVELNIPIKGETIIDTFLDETNEVGNLLHKYRLSLFSTLRLPNSKNINYLRVDLRNILQVFSEVPFELWGRIFWSNVNEQLYFTTKLSMLEHHLKKIPSSQTIEAHSVVSLYPHNLLPLAHYWNNVWKQNSNRVCFAQQTKLMYMKDTYFIPQRADMKDYKKSLELLYNQKHNCPDGGKYGVEDNQVHCSIHSNKSIATEEIDPHLLALLHYFKQASIAVKIVDEGLRIQFIGNVK